MGVEWWWWWWSCIIFFNIPDYYLMGVKLMMIMMMIMHKFKPRNKNTFIMFILTKKDSTIFLIIVWSSHLEQKSVDDWVSACERWRWHGWDVRGGVGRFGKNVWMMTWKCLVTYLNGRYSGICGGTSYGQTSNPSLAWKKWTFSK